MPDRPAGLGDTPEGVQTVPRDVVLCVSTIDEKEVNLIVVRLKIKQGRVSEKWLHAVANVKLLDEMTGIVLFVNRM